MDLHDFGAEDFLFVHIFCGIWDGYNDENPGFVDFAVFVDENWCAAML